MKVLLLATICLGIAVALNIKEIKTQGFKCKDGSCINLLYVCDGTIDCPDGSDEIFCSRNILNNEKKVKKDNTGVNCSTYMECINGFCIDEGDNGIKEQIQIVTYTLYNSFYDTAKTLYVYLLRFLAFIMEKKGEIIRHGVDIRLITAMSAFVGGLGRILTFYLEQQQEEARKRMKRYAQYNGHFEFSDDESETSDTEA